MAKNTGSKKLKLFNTQESPILLFFLLTSIAIGLMSYDHRYQINDDIKQRISALNKPIKFIINAPSNMMRNFQVFLSDQKTLLK